jgi:adenylate kinase family enzyme
MSANPKVIFVLGGPGSGKGTHCDMLRERFSLLHLSVGDILREYLKSGSKEAQEISKRMKEGQMVPSRIVVEQLKKKILEVGKGRTVMVDGFPRNKENIDVWE